MSRAVLSLLASVALAAAACQAFLSSPESDANDATAPAVDGGEAGVADGPSEAADEGPSALADAGVDAPLLVRWCDGGAATLCADFDDPNWRDSWDASGPPLGGALEVVDGALRTSVNMAQGATAAALERVFSQPINRVTAAFNLRVVQIAPTAFAQLFTLRLEGSPFQVSLYAGDREVAGVSDAGAPDGSTMPLGLNEWPLNPDGGQSEFAVVNRPATAGPILDGAWHRVEVRLANPGQFGVASGTLLVDNNLAATFQLSFPPMVGPLRVFAGLSYVVSPLGPTVAEYDNFELVVE